MGKYYITTAIDYASGKGHIGNTYEKVAADVLARYHRKKGDDVYFQIGMDEHGQKTELKAEENNQTPQEYTDGIAKIVKDIYDQLNISYDGFVRTTNDKHKESVQKIYQRLYDQGDIYKGKYEGWYCTPCESFFTEYQLVNGKCPDCGREIKKTEEAAYFLKLSKYEKTFKKYLEENKKFIVPIERKNEIYNNFVKDGLKDLCVSRTSFDWGVKLPFDEKHISYVWIDALSNYITFLGYDAEGNHSEKYKKFWPADVHVVGKDILRFHMIYWPCILLALGEELPKQIFAHPWFLFGNDKMSKSLGNTLYSDDLIEKYGVDAIRFYLISELPLIGDGNLTEDLIVEKINAELANNFGNLLNRTVTMVNKYFDGKLSTKNKKEQIDNDLINEVLSLQKKVEQKLNEYKIAPAIKEIFLVFRKCNKYIDETCPWVLAKDENKKERLSTVLYNLLEAIRICTVLLESFLPETAEEVYKQLNTTETSLNSILKFGEVDFDTKLKTPTPLFNRIEKNN